MCSFTTISIYNDLSAGKTRIAMRPADHKFSGRINIVFDIVAKEPGDAGRKTFLHSWNQEPVNVSCNDPLHLCIRSKVIMLC